MHILLDKTKKVKAGVWDPKESPNQSGWFCSVFSYLLTSSVFLSGHVLKAYKETEYFNSQQPCKTCDVLNFIKTDTEIHRDPNILKSHHP